MSQKNVDAGSLSGFLEIQFIRTLEYGGSHNSLAKYKISDDESVLRVSLDVDSIPLFNYIYSTNTLDEWGITKQLVDGLYFMHNLGLVHGNITQASLNLSRRAILCTNRHMSREITQTCGAQHVWPLK